jgi:hypothetical protein
VSTIYRRERHITYVEQVVPVDLAWGACWVEVMKAVSAAIAELRAEGRIGPTEEPSADTLRMKVEDEAIVVYYEKVEVTR